MSTRLKPVSLLVAALAVTAAACSSDDGPTTPKPPTFEIVAEQTPLALAQDDSLQVGATVYDRANGTIASRTGMTLTSANASVLAVRNNNGVIKAVGGGSTTLTYSYTDPVSKQTAKLDVPVTVTAVPLGSVVVTSRDTTIFFDEKFKVTAVAKDASGKDRPLRALAYSTPDGTIATVGADGTVTPKGPEGTARVIVAAEGKADTTLIGVKNRPVTSVTVAPALASVKASGTVQLTATVFGTKKAANDVTITNRTLTWTSSDTTLATVDGKGKVTAAGTAPAGGALVTITAAVDGVSGSAQVVVNP